MCSLQDRLLEPHMTATVGMLYVNDMGVDLWEHFVGVTGWNIWGVLVRFHVLIRDQEGLKCVNQVFNCIRKS